MFYFSDSNEAQDISANFGYHYAEGYFLEDLIQENLDLKQACNADENNSAGWQNCKMAFDSLQIISKPVFLDLQIKNNLEEKNASTAEIAINNIYPKIIEFLPAGKTNTNEIYFKIQSENFDVDIPSIKVIVNDTIEGKDWQAFCQTGETPHVVSCDFNSELVKDGENFVYVESHDVQGNGSYASAKEWSFTYEK